MRLQKKTNQQIKFLKDPFKVRVCVEGRIRAVYHITNSNLNLTSYLNLSSSDTQYRKHKTQ